MISMSYACNCGFKTHILDDAQKHSNTTYHHMNIVGFLTPNAPRPVASSVSEEIAQKARDAAVLRAAKNRGLLKEKK